MVNFSIFAGFLVLTYVAMVYGSISTAILKPGDSFLIREAENAEGAEALVRSVAAGSQRMALRGKNKGKWVLENGKVLKSSNYKKYKNGSVLIKHASSADAGTYQKDPNPMIRIGDMGYAPPILIIQVSDNENEE